MSDDKLLRLFAAGATIVLQGLHRTWGPLIDFTQELAEELGHPVQANAYVTPRQNTGFSDHYDVHDVFVLQMGGEKRWRLRPPVHPAPLRDEPWTDHRAAVEEASAGEPALEFTLRPGDVLYLPRGWVHSATALGGVSTHLTLGVHVWTRRHLADALVDLGARGREPRRAGARLARRVTRGLRPRHPRHRHRARARGPDQRPARRRARCGRRLTSRPECAPPSDPRRSAPWPSWPLPSR